MRPTTKLRKAVSGYSLQVLPDARIITTHAIGVRAFRFYPWPIDPKLTEPVNKKSEIAFSFTALIEL